jgi:hypothetical protein
MRADIQMLQQEKAKQSAVFQNRKEQFGRLLAMVKELQTSISSERESTVSYILSYTGWHARGEGVNLETALE